MNAAAEQISAFASIAELGRALAGGSTTSTEIVQRALERIAAHDGELRAFVALFPEAALQAAHAADDRRRRRDLHFAVRW